MVLMSTFSAYALNISGAQPSIKWEVNFTSLSEGQVIPEGAMNSHWSSYQLVADIDGDPDLEVLWLVPFPVVVDGSTGEVEAYYVNDYLESGRWPDNGGWWGDIEGDGVSEWVCELRGLSYQQTQLYSLTLGGEFPAQSPWPEYYHCAYPARYQAEQDWLTLKSAGSNSLWFPITESIPPIPSIRLAVLVALAVLARAKKRQKTHARRSHPDPHCSYPLLDRL